MNLEIESEISCEGWRAQTATWETPISGVEAVCVKPGG